MRHPSSRTLFAYWDHIRGERASPERNEIDPSELRHVLPDTFILAADEGPTPTFRLAGTRLCALFGKELKGDTLSHLWQDGNFRELDQMYEAIMEDAAGVVGGMSAQTQAGRTLPLELLMLPLRHGGKTNTRILGSLSPMTPPLWLGLDPVISVSTLSLRMIWSKGHEGDPYAPIERRKHLVVHQGGRV
jgi:hypothetical protein